jgi:pilus assembly protein Flp/PilA
MLAWYKSYDLAGRLRDRISRDRGASAVEYGLIVALIAGAVIIMVFVLGNRVKNLFSDTCSKMTSTPNTPAACP